MVHKKRNFISKLERMILKFPIQLGYRKNSKNINIYCKNENFNIPTMRDVPCVEDSLNEIRSFFSKYFPKIKNELTGYRMVKGRGVILTGEPSTFKVVKVITQENTVVLQDLENKYNYIMKCNPLCIINNVINGWQENTEVIKFFNKAKCIAVKPTYSEVKNSKANYL